MTLQHAERTELPPSGKHAHNAQAIKQLSRRTKRARPDLYQSVTDTVIAELEAGTVPWVKPWGVPDVQTPFGLPSNGQTGNTYSGINILLL